MVSTEPVLLIVAADRRELSGLARRLGALQAVNLGLRWSRMGRLGARAVVLAAHGAGRANAAQVVQKACERFRVAGVVSAGLCGGLDPALERGRVVVADRVLSVQPPAEFLAQGPRNVPATAATVGPVVTVDRVVQTAEEKTRLRATGAVAVEMEAAGVAAEAERRKLPFFCVRVVSDGGEQSFGIDYNRALRPDGRFSAAKILAQAGWSAARWKELAGWRQGLRLGSERLGEFFGNFELES